MIYLVNAKIIIILIQQTFYHISNSIIIRQRRFQNQERKNHPNQVGVFNDVCYLCTIMAAGDFRLFFRRKPRDPFPINKPKNGTL